MTELIKLPLTEDALPTATPRELLTKARERLRNAATMPTGNLRYGTASLAAITAAAALIAARGTWTHYRQQGPPHSVWYLAKMVAPELERDLEYYASKAVARDCAASGQPITAADADREIADATEFVEKVVQTLAGAR